MASSAINYRELFFENNELINWLELKVNQQLNTWSDSTKNWSRMHFQCTPILEEHVMDTTFLSWLQPNSPLFHQWLLYALIIQESL